MVFFACPKCGKQLKVNDELAGKRARCPGCAALILIPLAPAGADAATRPPLHPVPPAPAGEEPTPPPSGPAAGSAREGSDGPTLGPGARPSVRPAQEVLATRPGDGRRYVAEGEIGRGGMGAVLRAVDCDIRREVALKYLLDGADERLKARFIEEAQITGQLEHPNIVPIHDLGVDGEGRLYFAMKMVRGRSLSEVLEGLRRRDAATAKEFTLGRLLSVVVNICNALAYAHARGVIHRDLKPANIMLGDFGEVYVMDWGLAKVLGQENTSAEAPSGAGTRAADSKVQTDRRADSNLTQDGAVLGTPAYMPPEQALGQIGDLDRRSDVYSLGAILFEMLTLEPPVGRSGDMMAILLRVAEGAVLPPEQAAPQRARLGLVPPELSAVALKALARYPADRYQTVEALQRDIQLFLEGRSVSAKRDSAWELLKKLVKRNKGVSAATAAALVVLAVVVGFFLKVNYDARVLAEGNYAAFLKEQDEKRARMKESAPAFLRAAHLAANEKDFKNALVQVNVALESDPELTEGYLLQGQLLLCVERFAEAAGPLDEYRRRKPAAASATRLAELARNPEPDRAAYFLALNDVLHDQGAVALARHMTKLAERFIRPNQEKLPQYRKQIESAWRGAGERLTLDAKGEFGLNLCLGERVRDLAPLEGLPLSWLTIASTKVEDLRPLRGMPLRSLDLTHCPVHDLGPLRGLPLTHLVIYGLGLISDLEAVRGMPLEYLDMRACVKVASLEPLRGMPLTFLELPDCPRVTDLRPLEGMRLKRLAVWNDYDITDLGPLRGQPLEVLLIGGLKQVSDFEFLRGMPLKHLDMAACSVRDLEFLRGMALSVLSVRDCLKLKSLTPLAGMKLTQLNVWGCRELRDFGSLAGMPLESLEAGACPHLSDLGLLRGMKLTRLGIGGCPNVHDLRPLEGMPLREISLTPSLIRQGMDVLGGRKGLEYIHVHAEGGGRLEPADFWKRYDKGEFRK